MLVFMMDIIQAVVVAVVTGIIFLHQINNNFFG